MLRSATDATVCSSAFKIRSPFFTPPSLAGEFSATASTCTPCAVSLPRMPMTSPLADVPVPVMLSVTWAMSFDGTASEIPLAPEEIIVVIIPTALPFSSKSIHPAQSAGAASVCKRLMVCPPESSMPLFTPQIVPSVIVVPSCAFRYLPIAATRAPEASVDESANSTGASPSLSIFRIAQSVFVSMPTTSAG